MQNTFLNIDCMDGMRKYPDKHFDLAIVDPPYGIGESGRKNKSRGCLAKSKEYKAFYGEDLKPPGIEYFKELFRVSKNQIIWGANHFIDQMPRRSPCWIVWDKQNGKTDFADCELAWTSFPFAVRKFTFRWSGMLQGDMAHKEKRIHPTQKPVALYKWLLQKYAKQGDLILDTHVGSASSLVACYELGYDYVGFEIDPHYCQLAQERINATMAQVRMEV